MDKEFMIRFLLATLALLLLKGVSVEGASCLPEYRFDGKKLILTPAEWKERLTPEEYAILRKGGTERRFTSPFTNLKEEGIYLCAGCALPLFSSSAKYDSGTGWPSFWEPICKENVTLKESVWIFSKNSEVLCSRCSGHLGHVFDDGPEPTGKRYCMNGIALHFKPRKL